MVWFFPGELDPHKIEKNTRFEFLIFVFCAGEGKYFTWDLGQGV